MTAQEPELPDLSKYVGGLARLWCYTRSHDALVIRLTARDGEEGYLTLSLCKTLDVDVLWTLVHPTLAREAGMVVFADAQVRVTCGSAVVHPDWDD